MSYTVFQRNHKFGPRKGLEGPYHFANGRVLYYCNKEGAYYDPTTDFFVDHSEVAALQQMTVDLLIR
jgi:hypothetical protein